MPNRCAAMPEPAVAGQGRHRVPTRGIDRHQLHDNAVPEAAHQDAKGTRMSTATKKTSLLPAQGGRSARRARAVAEAEQVRAQEAAYRPQNGYLSWLLTRCNRELGRQIDRVLDEVDLTEAQYGVLQALTHLKSASSATLARSVQVTPQAMVGLVAALERKGYITRTSHPGAGRVITTTVTALGQEAFDTAKRRIRALERNVRKALTDEEYDLVVTKLERLGTAIADL
jgi:DNA-binding MarR family transcriptional regulator